MTSSISPPPGVVGSDDWTAIDSKTGRELTDEEALKLTDAEVDWLKNDGTQRTYDSENEEYIEFKNKNSDGSGGVDTSYGTRVYDPNHPDADAEGMRDDATTTSDDNDTGSSVTTPKGIFQPGSTTNTQGWLASVDGKPISVEEASKRDPKTVTWTDAGNPNRTVSYDPEKNVWVMKNGTDIKHWDTQTETWNDQPGSSVTTPKGIFQSGSTTKTQGWLAFVDGKPISVEEASKRDPKTVMWVDADNSNHTIRYNAEKQVWEQNTGTETKYWDPQTETWNDQLPLI